MSDMELCQYCNQPAKQGWHFHNNTFAALPPAMTWTTEKPTKPGWYWWRFNLSRPRVTELVERYGELYDDERKHFVSDYVQQCEWAGPMEPPQ